MINTVIIIHFIAVIILQQIRVLVALQNENS
jgi:hypothetical protein